ncbi:hypothetical protein [Acidovorax sp.]|uniref:hypothetical protein n=1 Tax=Acidovorax sp. TaxID=1872122 RepID=UPI00391F08E9
MTTLLPATSPTAFATCLSLIAVTAALAGCGGGSDDPPLQDVALLAGDWQSQGCTVISSQLSQRGLLRLVRQDATRFTQSYGTVNHANGDCTGNGTVQLLPPETATPLVVRSTASTGSLAVFWAHWTQDSADTKPYGRWALQGDVMCPVFYAVVVAIFPAPPPPPPHTSYDLETATRQTDEMLQRRACYTRMPA